MGQISKLEQNSGIFLLVLFEQGEFDIFEIRDKHIYILNQPKGNEHEGLVTSIDMMGNYAVTCG
jgi:hypothetical protein